MQSGKPVINPRYNTMDYYSGYGLMRISPLFSCALVDQVLNTTMFGAGCTVIWFEPGHGGDPGNRGKTGEHLPAVG